MPATMQSVLRPRRGSPASWMAVAVGLALLAAFAIDGPSGPIAISAVVVAALLCAAAAPASIRPYFIPLLFASVVFGQLARGFYLYEVAVVALALVAIGQSLVARSRAAWRLAWPEIFALAFLVVPWLAVPVHVVSLESFVGGYKLYLGWVVLFLAARRVVGGERSHALLWIFPLIGLVGSIQLALKTSGLGDLLLSRPALRNFYTALPWGWSDFVSATMEVVVCACVILFLLDRRPLARAFFITAGVCAFASFLVLLSRGGAIGLLLFGLVMVAGLGGLRARLSALGALFVGVLGMLTPGGQALLSRFTDPGESGSVFMRFVLWATSWNRFLLSPLTGVGLNQQRYQHDFIGANSGGNLVLDMMADEGILGGVLLVGILVAAFRMAARAEPAGLVGSPRALRLAVTGLLVEWIFHASIEPTYTGPALAVPITFLLAWLTLQDPHARLGTERDSR